MPETPPFLWNVAAWRSDPKVTVLPTLARGVWRELLDVMHDLDHCGVITGTREELARLGRCSAVNIDQTLHELTKHNTANITERNGVVTLVNRRMNREHKSRCASRLRVEQHRKGGGSNAPVTSPYKLKGSEQEKPTTKLPQASLPDEKKPKLTPGQVDLVRGWEAALGDQWVNDAGKWVNRIKTEPAKAARVLAEVNSALTESRITSTPAQYAEQTWKTFR